MNPASLRALLCSVCLLCLRPGVAAAQRGAKLGGQMCAGVINTSAVSSLSIKEMSKLGSGLSIENDFGGLIFRPFDDDDRPRRGRRIEIGFILASSGDLGGAPVGIIVWTKHNLSFAITKAPNGTISVASADLAQCHTLAYFSFDNDGNVMMDHRVIARAR